MDMNMYVVANPHRCISCRACVIACAIAHLKTSVVVANMTDTPFQPRLNLVQTPLASAPIQCHHCENAPCAKICPVKAITQRDNATVVDTDKCIGCKSCLLACPFGAVALVPEYKEGRPEKRVAHKCDICLGRKDGPACVETCPASAFVVVKPYELRNSIQAKRTSAARTALGAARTAQEVAPRAAYPLS